MIRPLLQSFSVHLIILLLMVGMTLQFSKVPSKSPQTNLDVQLTQTPTNLANSVSTKPRAAARRSASSSEKTSAQPMQSARPTEKVLENDEDSTSFVALSPYQMNHEPFILELRAALEQLKEYPVSARARSLTGQVDVEFTLLKSGHLKDPKVVKACEFETLNSAALQTVSKLEFFKPIPDSLSKGHLRLVVPINFRLN